MLRCIQMGLTVADLSELDYGLVVDMMIESGNDALNWPDKATQEDFDKF